MKRLTARLNRLVTFQRKQEEQDGPFEVVSSWEDVFSAYAEVKPLRAAEQIENMRVGHKVSHLITVRYNADVTPDMRILYGARVFEIEGLVNVGEGNRLMQVFATEKNDG